jgi:hypothetical protein
VEGITLSRNVLQRRPKLLNLSNGIAPRAMQPMIVGVVISALSASRAFSDHVSGIHQPGLSYALVPVNDAGENVVALHYQFFDHSLVLAQHPCDHLGREAWKLHAPLTYLAVHPS